MVKHKTLTDEERQRLLDMYEVDDIINILELDMETLLDALEEHIVDNLDRFDLYVEEDEEIEQ